MTRLPKTRAGRKYKTGSDPVREFGQLASWDTVRDGDPGGLRPLPLCYQLLGHPKRSG